MKPPTRRNMLRTLPSPPSAREHTHEKSAWSISASAAVRSLLTAPTPSKPALSLAGDKDMWRYGGVERSRALGRASDGSGNNCAQVEENRCEDTLYRAMLYGRAEAADLCDRATGIEGERIARCRVLGNVRYSPGNRCRGFHGRIVAVGVTRSDAARL